MAQKVSVIITDDIDGSENASTHSFALDGTTWELDLSDKNYQRLVKALDPFLEVARKGGKGGRGRKASATTSTGPDPKAVRAWGMENGFADQIPARGRIPQVVREAYEAAN